MTASNETVLEIVDFISRKINGDVAQVDGQRPNKAEILGEINQLQGDECNERDYTFLRTTENLAGYNVLATQHAINPGAPIDDGFTLGAAYNTAYAAEVFTPAVDGYMTTCYSNFLTYGGFGALVATFTAYICRSTSVADLAAPLASSAPVSVDNLIIPLSTPVNFDFTASPLLFRAGVAYVLVIKMAFAGNNGSLIKPSTTATSGPGTYSTTTSYSVDGVNWLTGPYGRLAFNITNYNVSWKTELLIPVSLARVYSIYPLGAAGARIDRMYPLAVDNQSNNPDLVPSGRFWVNGMDATTGSIKVGFLSNSSSNVETWVIEGKKKSDAMVNDSDYPVLPSNYRGLLKYQAVLNFWALGFGQQDANTVGLYTKAIETQKKAMRREFLPSPPRGFSYNRGGSTPMQDVGSVDPNRSWVGSSPITQPRRF